MSVKRKTQEVRVVVRLEETVARAADERAAKLSSETGTRHTRSDVLRMALHRYLNGEENGK